MHIDNIDSIPPVLVAPLAGLDPSIPRALAQQVLRGERSLADLHHHDVEQALAGDMRRAAAQAFAELTGSQVALDDGVVMAAYSTPGPGRLLRSLDDLVVRGELAVAPVLPIVARDGDGWGDQWTCKVPEHVLWRSAWPRQREKISGVIVSALLWSDAGISLRFFLLDDEHLRDVAQMISLQLPRLLSAAVL